MFLDALKLYSARVVSRTAQTLSEASTPVAGIQAVFDDLTAGIGTDSGKLGCFMVNSVAELVPYDREVTKIAAAYSTSMERLFSEALTRAGAEGTVTGKQTPAELATYVFNAMQGIRILIKSGATRAQVEAVVAQTITSLR